MIKVRLAKPEYAATIVRLGKQLHSESSYANKGFNSDKANLAVTAMINSETDIALVVEDEQQIIGYFLGGITYEWFSDERIAFDYSVYVIPKKRNGRCAIKLFQAFEL